MRKAGKITAAARSIARQAIADGISTKEIDREVNHFIRKSGAIPTFLGYGGFPASACISVNEEVIHGIPGKRIVRSGDIVSVLVADYKGMGETVIPPELQYVEVISVTASSGYDANTGEAVEDEKELPSTVTLLVTTEQAKVLAGLEQESELHLALVYRGAPENADEFIAAQDALIEELYAEPEAEAAEGAENAESAETEESEGADPAAESEAAGE